MRTLLADEIECRVAQVTAKGCSLLLYKTARVDRAILDEMYTACGWQNDFKVIDGKMYGGIGVRIGNDNGSSEWVWKWDCGTESNTEAEKGQASDCFKRAGFKWGIGVELYTAPFIFIQVPTVQKANGKYELVDKYIKFIVTEIGYTDKREINKLVIKDCKGNAVFNLGKKIEPKQPEPLNDNDIDIIEGLKGMDCKENAHKYFKSYEKEISNLAAFKKAYAEIYLKLPSLEELQAPQEL